MKCLRQPQFQFVAEKYTEYIMSDIGIDRYSNKRKSNVEWSVLIAYENGLFDLIKYSLEPNPVHFTECSLQTTPRSLPV